MSAKLDHVVRFTNREVKTWIWGTAAFAAGDVGAAGAIFGTGFLAEHFDSVQPHDLTTWTAEDNNEFLALEAQADQAIDAWRAKSGQTYEVPQYPYNPLAAAGPDEVSKDDKR